MNAPPFVMMPFFSGPSQQGPSSSEVPPRVRAAMEFLNNLAFKTMTRAAVNDMSIQEMEGQKLTTAEANAQATACNMLTDYFRGALKPDSWEKKQHNTQGGLILECIACAPNPPKPNCKLCKGCGQLLVYPTTEE